MNFILNRKQNYWITNLKYYPNLTITYLRQIIIKNYKYHQN